MAWLHILAAYCLTAGIISSIDAAQSLKSRDPAWHRPASAALSYGADEMDSDGVSLHTSKKQRFNDLVEPVFFLIEGQGARSSSRLPQPQYPPKATRLNRSDSLPDSDSSMHEHTDLYGREALSAATPDTSVEPRRHRNHRQTDASPNTRTIIGAARRLGTHTHAGPRAHFSSLPLSRQISEPVQQQSWHDLDLHAKIESILASGSQPTTPANGAGEDIDLPPCISRSISAPLRYMSTEDSQEPNVHGRRLQRKLKRASRWHKGKHSLDQMLSEMTVEPFDGQSLLVPESDNTPDDYGFETSSDSEGSEYGAPIAPFPLAPKSASTMFPRVQSSCWLSPPIDLSGASADHQKNCQNKSALNRIDPQTLFGPECATEQHSRANITLAVARDAQTRAKSYVARAADPSQALEVAVSNLDFDAVPALVALRARGDIADPPPLLAAAEHGHLAAVQALLPHHVGSRGYMHIARLAIRQALFRGHADIVGAVLAFSHNEARQHVPDQSCAEKPFSLGSSTLNITIESLANAITLTAKEANNTSRFAAIVHALDVLVAGAPTSDIAMMIVNGDSSNLTPCTSSSDVHGKSSYLTRDGSPCRVLVDSARSTPCHSQKTTPCSSLQSTPERPVPSTTSEGMAQSTRVLFGAKVTPFPMQFGTPFGQMDEAPALNNAIKVPAAAKEPSSPHRYKTPERDRPPLATPHTPPRIAARSPPETPEKNLRTPERPPRTPGRCPKTPEKHYKTPERTKKSWSESADGSQSRSSGLARDRHGTRESRSLAATSKLSSVLLLRSRLMRELFVVRASSWRKEVGAELADKVDRKVRRTQLRLDSLAARVSDLCAPLLAAALDSPISVHASIDGSNLRELLTDPLGLECILAVSDAHRYTDAADLALLRLDSLLDAACAEGTGSSSSSSGDRIAKDSRPCMGTVLALDPTLPLLAAIIDMDSTAMQAMLIFSRDSAGSEASIRALEYAVLHDRCVAVRILARNRVPVSPELLLRADVSGSLCAPDLMQMVTDEVIIEALARAEHMGCVALRLEEYAAMARPAIVSSAEKYYRFSDATSKNLAEHVRRVSPKAALGESSSLGLASSQQHLGLARCIPASGMRSLMLKYATVQGNWPLVSMLLQCGASLDMSERPELVPHAVQMLHSAELIHMLVSVLGVRTTPSGLAEALITAASGNRSDVVQVLLKEAHSEITMHVVTALRRCSLNNAAARRLVSLASTRILAAVIVADHTHDLVYNELTDARRHTWRADLLRLEGSSGLHEAGRDIHGALERLPIIADAEAALEEAAALREVAISLAMPFYEVSGYESPVNAGMTAEEINSALNRAPLLDAQVLESAMGSCTVCCESFNPGDADGMPSSIPCGHLFHQRCISPWLEKSASCPICRSDPRTFSGGSM